jgi:hypothetical protein
MKSHLCPRQKIAEKSNTKIALPKKRHKENLRREESTMHTKKSVQM